MTKLQELQQEMHQLKNQANELMNKEGVTEAELKNQAEKIRILQAKINLEMENTGTVDAQNRKGRKLPRSQTEEGSENNNKIYEEAFYNKLRGKKLTEEEEEALNTRNSLSPTVPEDGGLLIPTDQQTEINELKRQSIALRNYVRVEPVTTLSGKRVIEKNAENTPFTVIDETGGTAIGDTESPQFASITYSVKSYGGILPVPKSLLQDQKANLRRYLVKWLSKKTTATENSLILQLLETLPKVQITGADDIKKAFNVTLDPAIALSSKITTNQDGFDYLDTLKDSNGKYLLTPDPTNPSKKLFNGKEIVVVSNKILKTATGKAPIFIGDLYEAIVLFDRETTELLATDVGGEAFKKNRVDIRAITRLDVKKFDASAVVFGQITIAG